MITTPIDLRVELYDRASRTWRERPFAEIEQGTRYRYINPPPGIEVGPWIAAHEAETDSPGEDGVRCGAWRVRAFKEDG